MKSKGYQKYIWYAVIGSVLSAGVGVLVKLVFAGSEGIHFMTLNFLRMLFGFIFLLALVPKLDKNAFKIKPDLAKEYFVIGFLLAVSVSLNTTANIFAPVNNVVLLAHMSPFFVLFFGYLLLKEKITVTKIVSLLIAVIGIAVMNPFQLGGEFALGNILALISSVFYAFLIIGMRQENRRHNIGDVMWFFFFATIILLPFAIYYGLGDIWSVFPELLLLGVVSTGMSYLFINLSLHRLEAEMESIIKTIVTPLFAIILAVMIIGEEITRNVIIGGILLIAAGVYLESHIYMRKKRR